LIRLDDFVLIGPGSEWFWVMAQFVALAGTGVAIYRQLRSQRSASLFEHMSQWDQEWQGIPMVRAKLALMLELQHRDPAAGIPQSADEVPDFFERVGYLVARGHINADDFWNDGAWSVVEFYWGILEPYVRHDRAADPIAFTYEWFEWLEREMRRIDAKRNRPHPPFDHATREAQIADRIAIFTAKLERESPVWPGNRGHGTARR
jgi:hypothetical protein